MQRRQRRMFERIVITWCKNSVFVGSVSVVSRNTVYVNYSRSCHADLCDCVPSLNKSANGIITGNYTINYCHTARQTSNKTEIILNEPIIKQAVRPVVGPLQYAPAPCKWWLEQPHRAFSTAHVDDEGHRTPSVYQVWTS